MRCGTVIAEPDGASATDGNDRQQPACWRLGTAIKTRLRQLVCVLVSISFLTNAYSADNETERDIKRLKKQIAKLEEQLDDYKGQQGQLIKQLRYSETEIGRLGRSIAAIQGQLERQQQTLLSLQNRQKALNDKRAKQEHLISEQVRIAFQLGRSNQIKLLLNQESPATVARAIRYLDYVNKARFDQLEAYAETLADIERLKPTIINEELRLQKTKDSLDTELVLLANEQSNRKIALNAINNAISNKDEELANRRAERERLEQLLVAVEQAVANLALPPEYRAFHERKGDMNWPVKGVITNQYGSRKISGGLRWQGVELSAPKGSPVRAIHNGRVVFANWFKGQGLLLIVDHGEGYLSLYAHNESLLRETGDWVKAGEPIASVGSSGGQQDNALYFEIRHNGKPINPSHWCTSKG